MSGIAWAESTPAITRIEVVGLGEIEQAWKLRGALESALPRDTEISLKYGKGALRLDGESDVAPPSTKDGQSIAKLIDAVQSALISKGFVTTRVLIGPQDVSGGVLVLTVAPGVVAKIIPKPDLAGWRDLGDAGITTGIPLKSGEVLSLRDIEQGVENMKRVPTADADIRIVPGEKPGESNLEVLHRQDRPIRLTVSVDDSGTRNTGKYQSSTTLNWDNPFMLNDLFSISYNHDLMFEGDGMGTEGYGVNYSVPTGYWLWSASYDHSTYRQTVSGLTQDYVYSGETDNVSLRTSRCIYRDSHGKTTGSLGLFTRASDNFVDDTKVAVQGRRTAGLLVGLQHRETFSFATIDASTEYRHGLVAFGSTPAPEEAAGDGTSKFRVLTGSIGATVPIPGERGVRYMPSVRGQYAFTRLTPPDRFSIGGRHTVHGTNGESTLSGEHGVTIRNELAVPVCAGHEVYGGVDAGWVGGYSTRNLSGDFLCGKYIGLRGAMCEHFNYDVFLGVPLDKPRRFETATFDCGFSVVMQF